MKLLTFLGVAQYSATTYTWQGRECQTRFAPVASSSFLDPERLIVYLTEEAEQQVFPDLKEALPPGLLVQKVPVPLGKDEAELWKIFAQISSAVQPGEEVAFDITHGLRSFPLLGLLAAAFLRSGLDVSVKAVLYGAYDVGKLVSPGYTPMFDLSPMLSLLEWATAADRFKRTGDARYLASLVKDQRKDLALANQGDQNALNQIGRLGNLAGALTDISQSLRLIRPHQVMEQVADLPDRLENAKPAIAMAAPVQPFALLLEDILEAYAPLAQSQPLSEAALPRTLEVERALIRWYFEREQWVQAVSLAREWLVSWVMCQLGLTQITQLNVRQRIETVVGGEASDYLESKKTGTLFSPIFLGDLPMLEDVLGFWHKMTKVRNDIDHAGMRADPGRPDDLIEQIAECLEVIATLPLP